MKPELKDLVWDDYHERFYTPKQVQQHYFKYVLYCKRVELEPEVDTVEHVNESNIGHVVYHAYMQLNWEVEQSGQN